MKKNVKDQKLTRRIRRLEKAIFSAYARMAIGGKSDYFDPINKLITEIADICNMVCLCQVFENMALYAFVCAAHEHWNTSTQKRGEFVRPDKGPADLAMALDDLNDAGWPCPGHTQFWDWVAELRRRPAFWKAAPAEDLRLNSWEWAISDWSEFDWEEQFDIVSIDHEWFVVGYLLDDHQPVYVEKKGNAWIAGCFGNASWREKEYISTGWRTPYAARWNICREPNYPGTDWYNGPGTEPAPDLTEEVG